MSSVMSLNTKASVVYERLQEDATDVSGEGC
jgi:hypothetical protein